jgi:hypothetical protein
VADHRLLALAGALFVCAAAGCGGSSGGSGATASYTAEHVRSAYFRAADSAEADRDYWVDRDFHSHTNYVPLGGIEACPLAQRADVRSGTPHAVEPVAGVPTGLFVVEALDPDDYRTPKITQGALVFPTNAIAEAGMKKVAAAMARCPPRYLIRGGPPPILGEYSLSARPLELDGWKGVAQQLAHTFPADDVYYEDMAHLVIQRDNVILYLDLVQQHVIGDRSDAVEKDAAVAKTILKRLG